MHSRGINGVWRRFWTLLTNNHMIQGEEKRGEQERVERKPDRGARAAGSSCSPPEIGQFTRSPLKLTDIRSIATRRSDSYRAGLSGAFMLQTVG
jgi:hypothetical protein